MGAVMRFGYLFCSSVSLISSEQQSPFSTFLGCNLKLPSPLFLPKLHIFIYFYLFPSLFKLYLCIIAISNNHTIGSILCQLEFYHPKKLVMTF